MFQHLLLKNPESFLSLTHKFEFYSLNIAFWFRMLPINLYPVEYSTENNRFLKIRKLFDDQAKKAHKIKPNKIWTSVLKSLTLTHINTLLSVP